MVSPVARQGATAVDAKLTLRIRATAAATLLAFAALLYYDSAFALVTVPLALPYLAVLVRARGKQELAWGVGTGWVLLLVSGLWVVSGLMQVLEGWSHLLNAAVSGAFAFAQAVLVYSASQAYRSLTGKGPAYASLLAVFYSGFFLFVGGTSIPGLMRARVAANESSAIGGLRTINTALETYKKANPDAGYPRTLEELARTGALDPILGCATPPCVKNHYQFRYTWLPPDASGPRYQMVARPVKRGRGGERSFYADQTQVLRFTSEDREAEVKDPPLL